MPRIRSIKPEFWYSQTMADVCREARLLAISLMNFADDDGRMVDNPKLLKAFAFPLDEDLSSDLVASWIDALVQVRWLSRYEHEGRRYLAITNFREHQHPQKPQKSKLPAPPPSPAPQEQLTLAPLAHNAPNDTAPVVVQYPSCSSPVVVNAPSESTPIPVQVGREGRGEEGKGVGKDYQASALPTPAAGRSPAVPDVFDLADDPEDSAPFAMAPGGGAAVTVSRPARSPKPARAPRTGRPKAPTAKWPHFPHEEREWICERLRQARKRDLTSGEIGWVTKAFGERWYAKAEADRHPDRPTNAEIRNAIDQILSAAAASENGRHFLQPVVLADSVGIVADELRQPRWDPVERLDVLDRLLGLRKPRAAYAR